MSVERTLDKAIRMLDGGPKAKFRVKGLSKQGKNISKTYTFNWESSPSDEKAMKIQAEKSDFSKVTQVQSYDPFSDDWDSPMSF